MMLEDRDLAVALGAWDLGAIASVIPHGRGMNSATWRVAANTGVWIAKVVPACDAAQFEAGLTVAARLEAAGLGAGAPRATIAGHLSVAVAGYQLAVLRFATGREVDSTKRAERRRWGAALGQAHRLLQAATPFPGLQGWHWVDPAAPHLDVEPWVRAAVRSAVEQLYAVQQETPFTYGVLHADPAPEAFLIDSSGQVAVIDWGSVTWGPFMYDVASARLYAGDADNFSALLDGYIEHMSLPPEELTALPTFLRFRWAVQADYFARRICNNDFTGIDGLDDNAKGLADARRQLVGR